MEVKRRKKKKESDEGNVEPTKEETAIGKYLRWNCPTKSSTMMGNKVEYFVASKAVDCLLDSNWASGKKNTEIIFTDRDSVADYLDRLLALGFFSRVIKIKKTKGKEKVKEREKTEDDESKKKKKEKKEKSDESKKDDSAQGQEQPDKETESKSSSVTTSSSSTSVTTGDEGKKKRKVKVKLELHEDQIFLDGDEAYVWIFDPVHPKTFIMGILVVLGSIGICLFPLWPDSVREGVWYISVIAAIGIGFILFLAVFRYILFGVIWVVSVGKHHFWLLPNLTEECGFLESFQPLYTYENRGKSTTDTTTTTTTTTTSTTQENTTTAITEEQQDEEKDSTPQDDLDKDTGSEDKEDKGDRDSWVKLTDEEVEKAKKEAKMDEYQLQPDEQETKEDTNEEKNNTTQTPDPIC